MTAYFPLMKRRMANQSNPYLRLRFSYSLQTLSCFMTFIILLQGPINSVAQPSQYESILASNNNNNNLRSTSTSSNNNDAVAYDDIYDDTDEDHDEIPLSTTAIITTLSSTIVSNLRTKTTPNISVHLPAQTEEGQSGDYVDGDDFEAYQNEDNQDAETTNQDDSQVFNEKISINDPNRNFNNRKGSDRFSTVRIPFVPSNLWRDLFSKPGILVGIIGGVVIGMLSAILLVMFIIYRMRKKDEGSYALEEGPRKSPSHAYTRVSSREFFA